MLTRNESGALHEEEEHSEHERAEEHKVRAAVLLARGDTGVCKQPGVTCMLLVLYVYWASVYICVFLCIYCFTPVCVQTNHPLSD